MKKFTSHFLFLLIISMSVCVTITLAEPCEIESVAVLGAEQLEQDELQKGMSPATIKCDITIQFVQQENPGCPKGTVFHSCPADTKQFYLESVASRKRNLEDSCRAAALNLLQHEEFEGHICVPENAPNVLEVRTSQEASEIE